MTASRYMTPTEREAMRKRIDALECERNQTPLGPERDELSERLDDLRDDYEDRL